MRIITPGGSTVAASIVLVKPSAEIASATDGVVPVSVQTAQEQILVTTSPVAFPKRVLVRGISVPTQVLLRKQYDALGKAPEERLQQLYPGMHIVVVAESCELLAVIGPDRGFLMSVKDTIGRPLIGTNGNAVAAAVAESERCTACRRKYKDGEGFCPNDGVKRPGAVASGPTPAASAPSDAQVLSIEGTLSALKL
eukprot:TRINITY_DN1907_c0_g1_i1.p3 TRINITY_DN1907_c0_g1~~TRINITY_DN1907_c0_g1_i1.p3  ORF type:complete len:196 (+),score=34.11 TRINITY_DN1907_c0_g1_i1:1349-1936(+)